MKKLLPLLILFLLGCAHNNKKEGVTVLPVSKVDWQKLNPARGDKSPQAGTLWGDRKTKVPTGFLAKFVDGFSSPPHIHNVSYRGVVIEGLVHNDDPKAKTMWMPKVSYWTQPAGEAHITSAKGKVNIALVEIDHGPYLVKPISQEFDNGERPFNIHASNIIWKNKDNYSRAKLWVNKDGVVSGSLVKFNKSIKVKSAESKFVVIKGNLNFADQTLAPGSLITNKYNNKLKMNCLSSECVVYLKSDKKINVQ